MFIYSKAFSASVKRKLVKVGHSSLMAAIPKKWLDANGLEQGDVVEFVEDDNKLVLHSPKEKYEKSITLTIENPTIKIVWREIQPIYTSGYDEVRIYYTDKKTVKIIEGNVDQLIGFEVTEITDDYVHISSVMTGADTFDPILRKVWHIVRHNAQSIHEGFLKKDVSCFENILTLEWTINKYTAYLKRMINRTGYKYSHYMYTIIFFLELVGNHYHYIKKHFLDFEHPLDKDYTKESRKLLQMYEKVHHLYYKYDVRDFHWLALEIPHFTWFEDMGDDEVKYNFKIISENLMHIARQIHAMNQ